MSFTIRPSLYKDQPAIRLESETIAAEFLPETGAKMCSLRYKPANLELLLQRPNEQYRLASYDGDYVTQGECSGFDEMFPSIDRCFYEGYPWRGTPIPDHGEVWSIPWTTTIEEHKPVAGDTRAYESLHFTVHGVRFPYQLEKWVAFVDDATLRTDYRLTNLSGFDLDFMWAAHMMLNLEDGATLTLPDGVDKIITALSFDGSLGHYGDEFAWPIATLPDGRRRDLRRMQPKMARDVAKYFVKGKMPEGWCKLTYPRSGCELRLSWPVEQVPYFALLPDEGGWQDLYSIFVEPATASFDRLDVARVRGELSTIKARSTVDWHLAIQLA
jgi:hypothetical protein